MEIFFIIVCTWFLFTILTPYLDSIERKLDTITEHLNIQDKVEESESDSE